MSDEIPGCSVIFPPSLKSFYRIHDGFGEGCRLVNVWKRGIKPYANLEPLLSNSRKFAGEQVLKVFDHGNHDNYMCFYHQSDGSEPLWVHFNHTMPRSGTLQQKSTFYEWFDGVWEQ